MCARRLATGVEAVRGDVRRAALADDRHLDLARVLELVLDLARDLVREQDRRVVVDLLRLDDHADLAAGLQRVDLLDARPCAASSSSDSSRLM